MRLPDEDIALEIHVAEALLPDVHVVPPSCETCIVPPASPAAITSPAASVESECHMRAVGSATFHE
jgi:hypothetical protein